MKTLKEKIKCLETYSTPYGDLPILEDGEGETNVFTYEDVIEAVLEFEKVINYFEAQDLQKIINWDLMKKYYKKTFGNFEK